MRLKTLNGAPWPRDLDFSPESLRDVTNCHEFNVTEQHAPNDSTLIQVKWRSLAPDNVQLHTGWSQPYLPRSGQLDGNANISTALPDLEQSTIFGNESAHSPDVPYSFDDELSIAEDFLEQSFHFHDSVLSSQIAPDADQTVSSSSFLATSFETTQSDFSNTNEVTEHGASRKLLPKVIVTSLNSLYTARELHSISPNIPTSNLVCVLTSNPEWRQVIVRKSGLKASLCEIVVADDTNTGFKITFWLCRQQESNKEHKKREDTFNGALEHLQVGDVLLLRNVALASFRDTVYGQSLHPAITRAKTTIDVLMQHNGVPVKPLSKLPTSIAEPFARVRKWARAHIATTRRGTKRAVTSPQSISSKRKMTRSTPNETLPPNTLEAV